MKIAILVLGFPPKRVAGTQIAAYNIAKHLARRGHEVHVITSSDEGMPKESMEKGFFVHRVQTGKKPEFSGLTQDFLSFLIIKNIAPDVIHCQAIPVGILAGFLAKRIMKKPYVVFCQGSDVYLSWRFKKSLSKLVLKNADAVIALTEDMKKEIQKIHDRKVFIIPNGIDLGRFKDLSKEDIRKRLKIINETKIILFVGTLRPIKGVRYLVEAMKIIRQKNTNSRLMLVGDGEDKKKLEKLVKGLDLEKYVRFIGKVPNEKVPEYMIASDVFVLPSLSESFGIVNLEAMASGLPIVATKVRGLPEIIKEGENGLLVEPKDPEAIAEKVLLVLEDEELREQISKNNKKTAEKYSWESVVKKLEQIYQNYL